MKQAITLQYIHIGELCTNRVAGGEKKAQLDQVLNYLDWLLQVDLIKPVKVYKI